MTENKQENLQSLYNNLNNCTACELRAECIAPVGSYGNPKSPLVIVGEGPGRQEDEYGCPLIGQSGQLLDKALLSVGITRDCIITTNVVKCRPKNNKTPNLTEASFCAQNWLDKEIDIIKPSVLIALGSVALHYLGGAQKRITKERGLWFETKFGIPCITTFHPAYLLRLYGESLKTAKWQVYHDLKAAKEKCLENNPQYNFKSDIVPDLFKIFAKRIP